MYEVNLPSIYIPIIHNPSYIISGGEFAFDRLGSKDTILGTLFGNYYDAYYSPYLSQRNQRYYNQGTLDAIGNFFANLGIDAIAEGIVRPAAAITSLPFTPLASLPDVSLHGIFTKNPLFVLADFLQGTSEEWAPLFTKEGYENLSLVDQLRSPSQYIMHNKEAISYLTSMMVGGGLISKALSKGAQLLAKSVPAIGTSTLSAGEFVLGDLALSTTEAIVEAANLSSQVEDVYKEDAFRNSFATNLAVLSLTNATFYNLLRSINPALRNADNFAFKMGEDVLLEKPSFSPVGSFFFDRGNPYGALSKTVLREAAINALEENIQFSIDKVNYEAAQSLSLLENFTRVIQDFTSQDLLADEERKKATFLGGLLGGSAPLLLDAFSAGPAAQARDYRRRRDEILDQTNRAYTSTLKAYTDLIKADIYEREDDERKRVFEDQGQYFEGRVDSNGQLFDISPIGKEKYESIISQNPSGDYIVKGPPKTRGGKFVIDSAKASNFVKDLVTTSKDLKALDSALYLEETPPRTIGYLSRKLFSSLIRQAYLANSTQILKDKLRGVPQVAENLNELESYIDELSSEYKRVDERVNPYAYSSRDSYEKVRQAAFSLSESKSNLRRLLKEIEADLKLRFPPSESLEAAQTIAKKKILTEELLKSLAKDPKKVSEKLTQIKDVKASDDIKQLSDLLYEQETIQDTLDKIDSSLKNLFDPRKSVSELLNITKQTSSPKPVLFKGITSPAFDVILDAKKNEIRKTFSKNLVQSSFKRVALDTYLKEKNDEEIIQEIDPFADFIFSLDGPLFPSEKSYILSRLDEIAKTLEDTRESYINSIINDIELSEDLDVLDDALNEIPEVGAIASKQALIEKLRQHVISLPESISPLSIPSEAELSRQAVKSLVEPFVSLASTNVDLTYLDALIEAQQILSDSLTAATVHKDIIERALNKVTKALEKAKEDKANKAKRDVEELTNKGKALGRLTNFIVTEDKKTEVLEMLSQDPLWAYYLSLDVLSLGDLDINGLRNYLYEGKDVTVSSLDAYLDLMIEGTEFDIRRDDPLVKAKILVKEGKRAEAYKLANSERFVELVEKGDMIRFLSLLRDKTASVREGLDRIDNISFPLTFAQKSALLELFIHVNSNIESPDRLFRDIAALRAPAGAGKTTVIANYLLDVLGLESSKVISLATTHNSTELIQKQLNSIKTIKTVEELTRKLETLSLDKADLIIIDEASSLLRDEIYNLARALTLYNNLTKSNVKLVLLYDPYQVSLGEVGVTQLDGNYSKPLKEVDRRLAYRGEISDTSFQGFYPFGIERMRRITPLSSVFRTQLIEVKILTDSFRGTPSELNTISNVNIQNLPPEPLVGSFVYPDKSIVRTLINHSKTYSPSRSRMIITTEAKKAYWEDLVVNALGRDSVTVLTVEESRGLSADEVYVDIPIESQGDYKRAYTALSRATSFTFLVSDIPTNNSVKSSLQVAESPKITETKVEHDDDYIDTEDYPTIEDDSVEEPTKGYSDGEAPLSDDFVATYPVSELFSLSEDEYTEYIKLYKDSDVYVANINKRGMDFVVLFTKVNDIYHALAYLTRDEVAGLSKRLGVDLLTAPKLQHIKEFSMDSTGEIMFTLQGEPLKLPLKVKSVNDAIYGYSRDKQTTIETIEDVRAIASKIFRNFYLTREDLYNEVINNVEKYAHIVVFNNSTMLKQYFPDETDIRKLPRLHVPYLIFHNLPSIHRSRTRSIFVRLVPKNLANEDVEDIRKLISLLERYEQLIKTLPAPYNQLNIGQLINNYYYTAAFIASIADAVKEGKDTVEISDPLASFTPLKLSSLSKELIDVAVEIDSLVYSRDPSGRRIDGPVIKQHNAIARVNPVIQGSSGKTYLLLDYRIVSKDKVASRGIPLFGPLKISRQNGLPYFRGLTDATLSFLSRYKTSLEVRGLKDTDRYKYIDQLSNLPAGTLISPLTLDQIKDIYLGDLSTRKQDIPLRKPVPKRRIIKLDKESIPSDLFVTHFTGFTPNRVTFKVESKETSLVISAPSVQATSAEDTFLTLDERLAALDILAKSGEIEKFVNLYTSTKSYLDSVGIIIPPLPSTIKREDIQLFVQSLKTAYKEKEQIDKEIREIKRKVESAPSLEIALEIIQKELNNNPKLKNYLEHLDPSLYADNEEFKDFIDFVKNLSGERNYSSLIYPADHISKEEALKLIKSLEPKSLGKILRSLISSKKGELVRFIDFLKLLNSKGQAVYGLYKDGVISLMLTPNGMVSKTVVRHEVFHLLFNEYLSEDERLLALELVKQQYPVRSDIEAEELLADMFAQYKADNTLLGIIRRLFDKLLRLLNFSFRTFNTLEDLFYLMDNGLLKKKGSKKVERNSLLLISRYPSLQSFGEVRKIIFDTFKSLHSENSSIYYDFDEALNETFRRLQPLKDSHEGLKTLFENKDVLEAFVRTYFHTTPTRESEEEEDTLITQRDELTDNEYLNPVDSLSSRVKQFLSAISYINKKGVEMFVEPAQALGILIKDISTIQASSLKEYLEELMKVLTSTSTTTAKGAVHRAIVDRARKVLIEDPLQGKVAFSKDLLSSSMYAIIGSKDVTSLTLEEALKDPTIKVIFREQDSLHDFLTRVAQESQYDLKLVAAQYYRWENINFFRALHFATSSLVDASPAIAFEKWDRGRYDVAIKKIRTSAQRRKSEGYVYAATLKHLYSLNDREIQQLKETLSIFSSLNLSLIQKEGPARLKRALSFLDSELVSKALSSLTTLSFIGKSFYYLVSNLRKKPLEELLEDESSFIDRLSSLIEEDSLLASSHTFVNAQSKVSYVYQRGSFQSELLSSLIKKKKFLHFSLDNSSHIVVTDSSLAPYYEGNPFIEKISSLGDEYITYLGLKGSSTAVVPYRREDEESTLTRSIVAGFIKQASSGFYYHFLPVPSTRINLHAVKLKTLSMEQAVEASKRIMKASLKRNGKITFATLTSENGLEDYIRSSADLIYEVFFKKKDEKRPVPVEDSDINTAYYSLINGKQTDVEEQLKDLLRLFVINYAVHTYALGQLLYGDISQYKSKEDLTKRIHVATSPGNRPLVDSKYGIPVSFSVAVFSDPLLKPSEEYRDTLGVLEDSPIEITDANAFTTPKVFRSLFRATSIDFNLDVVMKLVYHGISPLSPIYSELKFTVVVLTDELVEKFPALGKIRAMMEAQGIDLLAPTSAVKIGKPIKPLKFDKKGNLLSPLDKDSLFYTDNRLLRVNFNPAAEVESDIVLPTQAPAFIDPSLKNVREASLVHKLQAKIIELSTDFLARQVRITEKGNLTTKSLKILVDKIKRSALLHSENEDLYILADRIKDPKDLLYLPNYAKKLVSLINASLSRSILIIRIRGSRLVLQTAFGTYDYVDDGKLKSSILNLRDELGRTEAFLPLEIHKELMDPLFKAVGWRIPVSDLHSGTSLTSKSPYPSPKHSKGNIAIPSPLLAKIQGHDFDGDVLYVMMYERSSSTVDLGSILALYDKQWQSKKLVVNERDIFGVEDHKPLVIEYQGSSHNIIDTFSHAIKKIKEDIIFESKKLDELFKSDRKDFKQISLKDLKLKILSEHLSTLVGYSILAAKNQLVATMARVLEKEESTEDLLTPISFSLVTKPIEFKEGEGGISFSEGQSSTTYKDMGAVALRYVIESFRRNTLPSANASYSQMESFLGTQSAFNDFITQEISIKRRTQAGITGVGVIANTNKAVAYLRQSSPSSKLEGIDGGDVADLKATLSYVVSEREPIRITDFYAIKLSEGEHKKTYDTFPLKVEYPDGTVVTRTSTAADTLLNLAVDEVKEGKLGPMGITDANKSLYTIGALMGIPFNVLTMIFSHPSVSKAIDIMRAFDKATLEKNLLETFNIPEFPISPDIYLDIEKLFEELKSGVTSEDTAKGIISTVVKLYSIAEEVFHFSRLVALLRRLPSDKYSLDAIMASFNRLFSIAFPEERVKEVLEDQVKKTAAVISSKQEPFTIPKFEESVTSMLQEVVSSEPFEKIIKILSKQVVTNRIIRSGDFLGLTSNKEVFENIILDEIPSVKQAIRVLYLAHKIITQAVPVYSDTINNLASALLNKVEMFFVRKDASSIMEEISYMIYRAFLWDISITLEDGSTFPLYFPTEEQTEKFVTELREKLIPLVATSDNLFISSLDLSQNSISISVDKGASESLIANIRQAFMDLYLSDRELALDIFRYAVIKDGLFYSRSSLSNVIPEHLLLAYAQEVNDRISYILSKEDFSIPLQTVKAIEDHLAIQVARKYKRRLRFIPIDKIVGIKEGPFLEITTTMEGVPLFLRRWDKDPNVYLLVKSIPINEKTEKAIYFPIAKEGREVLRPNLTTLADNVNLDKLREALYEAYKTQAQVILPTPTYDILSVPSQEISQRPIVLISGSRSITNLTEEEYLNLTNLIMDYNAKGYHFVVGDAPGVDTLIQQLLHRQGITNVTVMFPSMLTVPRNNVGNFSTYRIGQSFSLRDEAMVSVANDGIIVWDGKSPGTKRVMELLVSKGAKVHYSKAFKSDTYVVSSPHNPSYISVGSSSIDTSMREELSKAFPRPELLKMSVSQEQLVLSASEAFLKSREKPFSVSLVYAGDSLEGDFIIPQYDESEDYLERVESVIRNIPKSRAIITYPAILDDIERKSLPTAVAVAKLLFDYTGMVHPLYKRATYSEEQLSDLDYYLKEIRIVHFTALSSKVNVEKKDNFYVGDISLAHVMKTSLRANVSIKERSIIKLGSNNEEDYYLVVTKIEGVHLKGLVFDSTLIKEIKDWDISEDYTLTKEALDKLINKHSC